MFRLVLAAALACASLALAPSPVLAQKSQRAYAPDDLGQLDVPARIRVLEREYADQSGGRALPDDQLEFYLDQIQISRWSFSRIKQDMAESLRGSGGSWRPPGSGWNQRSLICSSRDRRYSECRTPFRGGAILIEQISDTRCVEGRTWGSRPGLVWVDGGCRGRFSEGRQGPGYGQGQGAVRCESIRGSFAECPTAFRGRAQLARQLSSQACIEGVSWGQRQGVIWVRNGCRADFIEGRGGWGPGGNSGGYSVTCASINGSYATCAWNSRYGRPTLIEQLSNNACIEGRSWGFQGNAIWVDNGCRGRFGSR